jgi:hypothetical protein
MERIDGSKQFPIGSFLPHFSLTQATPLGSELSVIDDTYLRGGDAALVVFTCNHCPYVKGSQQGLLTAIEPYLPSNRLRVVAISANDAARYPEDSFDAMRANASIYPFPYLYDESQEVAKLFDAACTPEVYLFDSAGVLVYHGGIVDTPREPSRVTVNYLGAALKQVFAGEMVDPSFVRSIGCSIKWR